jgi:hypothetical protein
LAFFTDTAVDGVLALVKCKTNKTTIAAANIPLISEVVDFIV